MFDASAFIQGAKIRIKPAAEVGEKLGSLPGGHPYRRSPPVIHGPLASWVVEEYIKREAEIVDVPDCQIFKIRQAVAFYGLVFTQDGILVRESLINREHEHSFMGLIRTDVSDTLIVDAAMPKPEPVLQGRHILMSQLYDGNYGHWLLDCLPRMVALQDTIDLSDVKFVVSWHPSDVVLRVFRATLSYYGVQEQQLVYRGAEFQPIDTLFYATPLTRSAWVKAPLAIRTLENLANKVGIDYDAPERIFITRPEGERRRLLNRLSVRAFFLERGYTEVCPACLTFEQQVRAFCRARYVVGALGADCTNVVFSLTGVCFLGFAPETMHDDFYWDLVSHKAGQYFCLHGSVGTKMHDMNADFSIDMNQLRAITDQFEAA